jgi:hypothetical protein
MPGLELLSTTCRSARLDSCVRGFDRRGLPDCRVHVADPGRRVLPTISSLRNTGLSGVAGTSTPPPAGTSGPSDVPVAIIDTGVVLNIRPRRTSDEPGQIAGNGIDDDHNGFVDDVHG